MEDAQVEWRVMKQAASVPTRLNNIQPSQCPPIEPTLRDTDSVDEEEEDESLLDPNKTLGTFTIFPHLPTELRLKIWRSACPKPRIIKIHRTVRNDYEVNNRPSGDLHDRIRSISRAATVRASASLPTVFHICHESRAEALKLYQRGFGEGTETGKIYWNPKIDTVYFHDHGPVVDAYDLFGPILEPDSVFHLLEQSLRLSLDKIQHLAIDLNSRLLDRFEKENCCAEILAKCTALKTLDLLLDPVPDTNAQSVVLLCEPLDVSICRLTGPNRKSPVTASIVEQRVAEVMDTFRTEHQPDWKPPVTRVMVIMRRIRRKSRWCVH